MSADRTPMVVAAARALCRMSSDACNVDFDDNWKTYSEDFVQEARTVLDAAGAPELLGLVTAIVNSRSSCFIPTVDEETPIFDWDNRARAVIAKATGATP